MKKIFKKNQIIITALALMIAIAGYLQYTGKEVSDEAALKEVSKDLGEDTYDISDEDAFTPEDIFTDTEDNSTDASAEAPADGTVADAGENADGAVADAGENADGATADSGENADAAMADAGAGDGGQIENPGEAVLTSTSVENIDFASEMKLNREQIRSKNKETLLDVINNTSITEAQKQEAVDAMIRLTDIAEREAAAEMLLEAKGFTDVVVSISDSNADVVLNMGEVTDAKRAQVEDIVKRKTQIAAENIVITPIQ